MADSPGMPPVFLNHPLCVDLKGPPVTSLEDVISIRFGENLAQCLFLEVSLTNWDAGSPGFKYGEKGPLQLGAGVSLYSGDIVLAEGTIATLAPSFPNGSAPTLRFTVDVKRPARKPLPREPRAALALGYGRELREFYPVLRGTAKSSPYQIEATGTADGLPSLRAGAILKIEGVGAPYSGEYAVTETTHTIDPQSGYRTSFVGSKAPRA
jgi:hypothetical protein